MSKRMEMSTLRKRGDIEAAKEVIRKYVASMEDAGIATTKGMVLEYLPGVTDLDIVTVYFTLLSMVHKQRVIGDMYRKLRMVPPVEERFSGSPGPPSY